MCHVSGKLHISPCLHPPSHNGYLVHRSKGGSVLAGCHRLPLPGKVNGRLIVCIYAHTLKWRHLPFNTFSLSDSNVWPLPYGLDLKSWEFSSYLCLCRYKWYLISPLTLKVLNFWKFTSYCSLKPLRSGMGEVVAAHTSPTLHPPSPPTVHQLSRLAL